ncbi:DUF7287 family protein [Halorubrum sp. DTA98]|uniref:DUF7287 family protein n=1 Tax=Halorubrum sp. DTA98 TaxID=3402163 RepID=UPI003AAB619D
MSGERHGGIPGTVGGRTDRGQTVLDFAIGMSVFLLAVGFTFAFVPSLLEPFSAGEGARMIVAERGAAHLTETSLSAGSAPGVLSAACTAGFFEGTDPADIDEDCGWTTDAAALNDELGVADYRGVNVTIAQGGEVASITVDGEDTRLAAGDAPPSTASVSTGSRIVDVDGETYRLTLRVW